MTTRLLFRPLLPLLGATCLLSPFYFKLERLPSSSIQDAPPRRLDIAIDSDEFVTATLSVVSSRHVASPLATADHDEIVSILDDARSLMNQARGLIGSDSTKAKEVVDEATSKFREAKERILRQRTRMDGAGDSESKSHHVGEAETEIKESQVRRETVEEMASVEDRDLDLSRSVYETYITFPECIEKLFEDCLDIVNSDLTNLGLSTVELVLHEKRNINQDGYNKVVIVTNAEASQVLGRIGDGIVSYPFTWDDAQLGTRTLGVEGKWNCQGMTPQDCCDQVKQSATNPDTKGNYLECHIFVPFGGVGNAKRNDRVFINLSPDGRVHEAPVIQ